MCRVVTWVHGLRGSNFYVGCVGYVGLNIFYVGQHFTRAIIFTWVAWVKIFYLGQSFLLETIFLRGSKFLRGSFLGGGWVSKKILISSLLLVLREFWRQYSTYFFSSTLCLSRIAKSKSKLKEGISRFITPTPLSFQR